MPKRSSLERDISKLAEVLIRDLTQLVYQSVHELLLHSFPGGDAIPIIGADRHRRSVRVPARPALTQVKPLKASGLRIDPDSQTVQVGSRKVRLTRSELHVFAYLAQHRGKWVPSNRLRQDVLGEPTDPGTDSPLLRVHIRNIRKKLGPAANKLVSKRRQGFMLR